MEPAIRSFYNEPWRYAIYYVHAAFMIMFRKYLYSEAKSTMFFYSRRDRYSISKDDWVRKSYHEHTFQELHQIYLGLSKCGEKVPDRRCTPIAGHTECLT